MNVSLDTARNLIERAELRLTAIQIQNALLGEGCILF